MKSSAGCTDEQVSLIDTYPVKLATMSPTIPSDNNELDIVSLENSDHQSDSSQASNHRISLAQSRSFFTLISLWNWIFSTPRPVKWLLERVPLCIGPPNTLPLRSNPTPSFNPLYPSLYIFITPDSTYFTSFNPKCLLYQTYLRFAGVKFNIVPSTNHASPSGELPFILTHTSNPTCVQCIPWDKIVNWTTHVQPSGGISHHEREDVFMSLIEHSIHRAWLFSLYLTQNFYTVAWPLTISSVTSNYLLQRYLARDIQNAAVNQLLRHSSFNSEIDADAIYSQAEIAFAAFNSLLKESTWIFDTENPGLIDAALFSYTHLILQADLGHGWRIHWLQRALSGKGAIIRHRNHILTQFFTPNSG